MPQFDLRYIKVAQYNDNNGTISYTNPTSAGDAMGANLELNFAEGRLYAEGVLSDFLREATGGTISLATKSIPDAAQQLMFGATTKTRTVGSGAGNTVTSLVESADDAPKDVGVAFYCPDMVNGVRKFSCVFIPRARFGAPAMAFRTKENNTITFQTPTTTGEFMPDGSASRVIREVAVCDTEAKAKSWVDLVLGGS